MIKLTLQETIDWLEKQPDDKIFTYANSYNSNKKDCGCLFTQSLLANRKDLPKTRIVFYNGHVGDCEEMGEFGIVEGHNEFWKIANSFSISKEKALKVLKTLCPLS